MAERHLKLRGDPGSPQLLLMLMVAAIFVTWAIGVIGGLAQRSDVLRRAEEDVFRMNQIIAEQTGSLFQEVRVSLQMLDVWIRDNPQADPRTDPQFIHLVDNLRKEARIRIDLRLVSETNGLFFIPSKDTTGPESEAGALEYVRVQKEPATRGYYIARPIRSRESRVWGIPVSYPLTKHNAGISIIVAIIDLPRLNQLYETIRPRPDGAITLLRKDGTILDRVPFDFKVMGATVAGDKAWQEHREGVQSFVFPIGHQEEVISIHSIPGLPLVVSVSLPTRSVLAAWRERMLAWGAALAITTVVLLLLGMRLRNGWLMLAASEKEARMLNEEIKRGAEELKKAQEMSRVIMDNSNDIFTVLSLPDLRCEYVSPSVLRNRGWTQEEFMALSLDALLNPEMAKRYRDKLSEMKARLAAGDPNGRYDTLELDLPHKDGHVIPYELMATIVCDQSGNPVRLLTLARDLSERKANEEMIRRMAFYDRLTNLPNRRMLEDRLQQVWALAVRERSKFALLFIDLDKFKPINDTFGHACGDWILQQVAERMKKSLRASDTVARVGGDEFVILLHAVESVARAMEVAKKILASVVEPYLRDDGLTLEITASIGVVLYPDHGTMLADLVRLGDQAMYLAKKNGRNRVEVWGDGNGAAQ